MEPKNTIAEPEKTQAPSPAQEEARANDAASPSVSKTIADANAPKSWGEKYKGRTYGIVRNVIVNYFINFAGSAALTYAFDTSNRGIKFAYDVERKTKEWAKHGIPPGLSEWIIKYLTKSQLLLLGGHFLQPIVKWMGDHRQGLEFNYGHKLDVLQETLGFGNAASKRSLKEYRRVSQLIETHPSSALMSDEDKELLAKHHVLTKNQLGENLQFDEHRRSWGQVIKARGMSMLTSAVVSIGMGLASAHKVDALNFRKRERQVGVFVGKKVIERTPGLRSIFWKQPELMGEYFVDDAILTAAATAMYVRTEKKQDAKGAKKTDQETPLTAADKILNQYKALTYTQRSQQDQSAQSSAAVGQ